MLPSAPARRAAHGTGGILPIVRAAPGNAAPVRVPGAKGRCSTYRYPLGSDGFIRRRRLLRRFARGGSPVSLPLNRREILGACGAIGAAAAASAALGPV